MDDFEIGEEIEFYSSENGGCWKPGVVAEPVNFFYYFSDDQAYAELVRIHVGNGVHIIRSPDRCRRAMNLPIDMIPGTTPRRFKWRQTVTTPAGPKVVDFDGTLPTTVEESVMLLIGIAKQQAKEIETLKKRYEGLCEVMAEQDKKTEEQSIPQGSKATPVVRKGKG